MRFTSDEEDLIRWLYYVAGGDRRLIAKHFECSVDAIQAVVSTGLGETLKSGNKPTPKKPHISVFLDVPELPEQKVQIDRAWLRYVFSEAFEITPRSKTDRHELTSA